ncbi:sodium-dependent transporter [Butyrivibrio sp. XPD2002]|uniref:sodium-dependent transporter n=1 Tax=Butyrivibrio sp. XPD2002 TaxID=1280665 RepID=UPI00047E1EB9
MLEQDNRSSFSGKIGYVLAAAGASVGLGNIWRFPYLCARYGGGIFLLVYIILALTFGYTMIIAETAIGRTTKKSPVGAFRELGKNEQMQIGGWINAIIPMLIVPYYSVIGGWVCKYLYEYITADAATIATDDFFVNFITDGSKAELWFIIFMLLVVLVIIMGVENGIEKVSKFIMPILLILAVAISVYSVSRPGALAGVKYMLLPDMKHFSWMTVVSAMGQMFYSLSIAMGILITFGSYVKDDVSIEESTKQVEIFDTGIAVLASLMIIPAVFSFSGGDPDSLNAGPSLMFITMPKIFASMGFGRVIGILFFALVLFAAVTSAIALTESAVSTFTDEFKCSRGKATGIMVLIMVGLGSLSSLGNGPLSNITIFKMQFLDFFDFLTNSVMMPIAAFAICMLVVNHMGVEKVEEEVTLNGHPFRRRAVFRFMIRFLCPLFVIIILFSSVAQVLGLIRF